MIKINIKKQGKFVFSTPKVKKELSEFLKNEGISSDADINILIVGKNEMLKIGKKYISANENLHNVLSFTSSESGNAFLDPPDGILHLGDIALCYPKVVEEASSEGTLVEDKVIELLKHGAYHLLGKHHE